MYDMQRGVKGMGGSFAIISVERGKKLLFKNPSTNRGNRCLTEPAKKPQGGGARVHE